MIEQCTTCSLRPGRSDQGRHLAPLLYASDGLVNAMVPTEVQQGYCDIVLYTPAGNSEEYLSFSWFAAPSIFTSNGIGFGQAAALNQDGSVNSSSNPAARGSVITVFGTGTGVTNPEFPDGAVVTQAAPATYGAIAVIGVSYGTVQYVGVAPDLVNGVMQLNVTIPSDVAPGPLVPIRWSRRSMGSAS